MTFAQGPVGLFEAVPVVLLGRQALFQRVGLNFFAPLAARPTTGRGVVNLLLVVVVGVPLEADVDDGQVVVLVVLQVVVVLAEVVLHQLAVGLDPPLDTVFLLLPTRRLGVVVEDDRRRRGLAVALGQHVGRSGQGAGGQTVKQTSQQQ